MYMYVHDISTDTIEAIPTSEVMNFKALHTMINSINTLGKNKERIATKQAMPFPP